MSAVSYLAPDASSATQVLLGDEDGPLARFELRDELRGDAVPAIDALRALGLEVEILSGDAVGAVHRVAGKLGIEQARSGMRPEQSFAAGRLVYLGIDVEVNGKRVSSGLTLEEGVGVCPVEGEGIEGVCGFLPQFGNDGEVRILVLTDAQFSRMKIYQGKRRKSPERKPEQLEFF